MRSSGPDRALSESTSNVRDNPSLLTPAQLSRWQGLPLGWVGTPEGAWSSKFSPASTVLSLLDTGALRARINVSGRSRDIDVKANAMALLCANDEVRVDQLDCSRARRILLHLDVATLSRHGLLFDDDLVTVSLRQSHEFYDPALAAVLRAMLREIKQGCPNGTLFAESLSVGVALQLCRTRGLHAPPAAAERGKLSPWQWSRLNDLLVSELASDLSLSALSACVNLSKPHFVRLFRNTTGTSPHRYVAQKRVERARQLIQTSNLPLIDIAAEAGFASQSHLGRMFQKRYGLTPGDLRKQAAARRTRT
jgi:AraC family transcriptional regulator